MALNQHVAGKLDTVAIWSVVLLWVLAAVSQSWTTARVVHDLLARGESPDVAFAPGRLILWGGLTAAGVVFAILLAWLTQRRGGADGALAFLVVMMGLSALVVLALSVLSGIAGPGFSIDPPGKAIRDSCLFTFSILPELVAIVSVFYIRRHCNGPRRTPLAVSTGYVAMALYLLPTATFGVAVHSVVTF